MKIYEFISKISRVIILVINNNKSFASGLFASIFGMFAIYRVDEFELFKNIDNSLQFYIFYITYPVSFFIAGYIVFWVFDLFARNIFEKESIGKTDIVSEKLPDDVGHKKVQINPIFSGADIEKISSDVSEKLSNNIEENIYRELTKKYKLKIIQETSMDRADDVLSELIDLLEHERRLVSNRTAANLVLGFCIAVTGIWIIYNTLSVIDFEVANWDKAGLQIVSRLSVVIIIEIFAYFFLNLYKSGLQEIKYYRNEITNNMSKRVAIRLAFSDQKLSAFPELISKFTDTERNFVLKKGERTILNDGVNSSAEGSQVDAGALSKGIFEEMKKANVFGSSGQNKA